MIDGNKGNNDITSHAREKTMEQWLNEGVNPSMPSAIMKHLPPTNKLYGLIQTLRMPIKRWHKLLSLGRYKEASDLDAKARQKQHEQDELPGMWKRVDVPEHIFERMLGFSIPLDHEVVIISYDNIAMLDLTAPANIQFDDAYPEGGEIYNRSHQTFTYRGKSFQILGHMEVNQLQRVSTRNNLCLTSNTRTLRFSPKWKRLISLLVCRYVRGLGDITLL